MRWTSALRLGASGVAAAGRAAGSTMPLGRNVYVAGQGQVPVTRMQADATLAGMGSAAVRAAMADAAVDPAAVTALFVGNMMAGMLSRQQHIGPLVASAAGLDGVEAATAEVRAGTWAAGTGRGRGVLVGDGGRRRANL